MKKSVIFNINITSQFGPPTSWNNFYTILKTHNLGYGLNQTCLNDYGKEYLNLISKKII